MMLVAEAQELLTYVEYKPDWKIELNRSIDPSDAFVQLQVIAYLDSIVDGVPKGIPIAVSDTESIPTRILAEFDQDRFLKWVFTVVRRVELHEAREWFRLGGRPVYEPHPENHGRPFAVERPWSRGDD